jgi:hypothetical protein
MLLIVRGRGSEMNAERIHRGAAGHHAELWTREAARRAGRARARRNTTGFLDRVFAPSVASEVRPDPDGPTAS